VQAVKELAILSGHRIERREHQAVKKVIRQMADAEIFAMIEADLVKQGRLPEPGGAYDDQTEHDAAQRPVIGQ
jgi:hypothetical protein